jgi:hypothetical protein
MKSSAPGEPATVIRFDERIGLLTATDRVRTPYCRARENALRGEGDDRADQEVHGERPEARFSHRITIDGATADLSQRSRRHTCVSRSTGDPELTRPGSNRDLTMIIGGSSRSRCSLSASKRPSLSLSPPVGVS